MNHSPTFLGLILKCCLFIIITQIIINNILERDVYTMTLTEIINNKDENSFINNLSKADYEYIKKYRYNFSSPIIRKFDMYLKDNKFDNDSEYDSLELENLNFENYLYGFEKVYGDISDVTKNGSNDNHYYFIKSFEYDKDASSKGHNIESLDDLGKKLAQFNELIIYVYNYLMDKSSYGNMGSDLIDLACRGIMFKIKAFSILSDNITYYQIFNSLMTEPAIGIPQYKTLCELVFSALKCSKKCFKKLDLTIKFLNDIKAHKIKLFRFDESVDDLQKTFKSLDCNNYDTTKLNGSFNNALLVGDNIFGSDEDIKNAISEIRATISKLKLDNSDYVFKLEPEDYENYDNQNIIKLMEDDGEMYTIYKKDNNDIVLLCKLNGSPLEILLDIK